LAELLHVSLDVGSVTPGIAGHSTVPSAGWLTVAAVFSLTLHVALPISLVLPHASMACQVLVRVYDPPHPAVELSLSSTIEELLHVSLEVGSVNTGMAGHSTVPLSPCPPIVGGVLSS